MGEEAERSRPPFALTPDEYSLVAALVEAVVPAGADPVSEPGGREVGGHNYFDSRLCEMSEKEREYVRNMLLAVQRIAIDRFGRKFEELSVGERGSILRSLLADPETRADFFALRALCLEAYYSDYCDPWYTGKTAWQTIGFGGRGISGIKKDWSFLRLYRVGGKGEAR